METPPKNLPGQKPQDDDIDLGKIFDKTGGMIATFFKWVDRGLNSFSNGVLDLLFLLRRNFIWLLAGTLAGVGLGIYFHSKNGDRYTSTMTVRANFNSTRALYSTIGYLNALINNRETSQLGKIFNISQAQASTLTLFEAKPIKTEKIVSDMYSDQFMRQGKDAVKRLDTFWTKTVPYKDYKSSLSKYDYPIHDITVVASDVMIFSRIQQGILNEISSNSLLQQMKSTEIQANNNEVDLLTSSIKTIDTLRKAYYQRLTTISDKTPANNLTLVDGRTDVQAPELQLYDKLLELKNELKTAQVNSVLQGDILMVYAPFGRYGEKEAVFKRDIVRWSLVGFATALVIVLFLAFYRHLTELEKRFYVEKQKRLEQSERSPAKNK